MQRRINFTALHLLQHSSPRSVCVLERSNTLLKSKQVIWNQPIKRFIFVKLRQMLIYAEICSTATIKMKKSLAPRNPQSRSTTSNLSEAVSPSAPVTWKSGLSHPALRHEPHDKTSVPQPEQIPRNLSSQQQFHFFGFLSLLLICKAHSSVEALCDGPLRRNLRKIQL